jgi:hypothetical protein
MLRGYRGFIIAAGLACLFTTFGIGLYLGTLNYPDEQRHQEYRYTDKDIADTQITGRAYLPKAKEYKAPCDKPYGKDESDLCAQWRAAKAAENSAFWTKWGFWIAVIGSSLLLWQIMLTREAVQDTGRATDAMALQNEIAKDAIRPWLRLETPKTAKLRKNLSGGVEFWPVVAVDIHVTNFGQSPAILPKADVLFFKFGENFNRLTAQNALFDEMDKRGFGIAPIYPNDSGNLGKDRLFYAGNQITYGCVPDETVMMIGVRYGQAGRTKVFYITKCFFLKAISYDESLMSDDSIIVTLDYIDVMTEAT